MAILTVSKAAKAYGKVEILSDVSFDLEPGEKAGLVGVNGSGKTTIFRIITGEVEADRGEVNVARNLSLAYMPQAVALDRDTALLFDAAPNLILTPHIAGVTVESNERVSAMTAANVRKALKRKRA